MLLSLQIIGGILLLLLGGELLVRSIIILAKTHKIFPLLLGLIVALAGTSLPLLAITIRTAVADHPAMILSSIIGTNLAILLLATGITTILYPLTATKRIIRFDSTALLYATFLFYLCCWSSANINRLESVLLLFFLGGYIVVTLWHAPKLQTPLLPLYTERVAIHEQFPLASWQAFVVAGIGLVLLLGGSVWLVNGAMGLVQGAILPEAVIALTMLGAIASLPTLAVAVVAILRNQPDVAITTLFSTALFTITGIPGIIALIGALPAPPGLLRIDLPLLAAVTLALCLIIRYIGTIHRVTGFFLVIGYAYYIAHHYGIF